jgi:hypothetical protein
MSGDKIRSPFTATLDHRIKIFWQCRQGGHDICPASLKVEPSRMDPDRGRVPSGRHVTIYCECACHARIKNDSQNASK